VDERVGVVAAWLGCKWVAIGASKTIALCNHFGPTHTSLPRES